MGKSSPAGTSVCLTPDSEIGTAMSSQRLRLRPKFRIMTSFLEATHVGFLLENLMDCKFDHLNVQRHL